MDRRSFLRTGSAAGAAALATSGYAFSSAARAQPPVALDPFALDYAPHFGMFSELAGEDLVAQLEFAAEEGFAAWEDNGMMGRPVEEQERLAAAMERLGMQMGVFVAHTIDWQNPNLASGDEARRAEFLEEIRRAVDVARRVNATWMTVVPGTRDHRLAMGYQTAHVVETLRRAAALLEPHGLVMVLEPLNPRDHPSMFLSRSPQAYQICKAVGSPACKILYDVYHQQITEGNLIPNIDRTWEEIAYFQIGDNPGRNEPTTGEINYRNIFAYIHERGYEGILGMEHGQSMEGAAGERAVIEAYRTCDPAA